MDLPGEHLIRLRAGWELRDDRLAGPSRVDLPLTPPGRLPAGVRLLRAFGRPRFDPVRESIRLRVEAAPGLRGALLNDRPLPLAEGSESHEWIVEGLLGPRNVLVLEVGPDDVPEAPAPGWGVVALRICSRGASNAGPSVAEGGRADL